MMDASSTTQGNGVGRGLARRTLGICLLLVVVVLWTTSNFLASVCTLFPGFCPSGLYALLGWFTVSYNMT